MNLSRRHKNRHIEIYTHSMSDILFFLLFFFLIAFTLANPNVIKLTLPKADTNTSAKQTVVVSIDANRNFSVGTKAVSFEQLEEEIRPFLGNQTDPAIVINADKSVPIEEVVKVMNIAKDLKVKVVLATKPIKE
jgi:biopolymer transport protein ExbD